MQQISIDQARDLYSVFGKLDTGSAELTKYLDSKNIPGAQKITEVLKKIANNCSEKEFIDYVMTNETPAIKLTNEEMEVIKGGITPYILVVGVGAGLGFLKKYCF